MSKGDFKEATKVAMKYHSWQIRKDGTPYVTHPIRVANFLEWYGFPEEALIAAVLHDSCEDTELTVLDINKLFWTRVGFTINALSKNQKPKNNKKLKKEYEEKRKKKAVSNLEKYDTLEEYIDFRFHIYINRMYMWILAEPWVFFIKVSDQIDNLWDMKFFSNEKKLRKIEEVEKYFLPIYEKSKSVFTFEAKYTKLYNTFMNILQETISNAKLNAN